MQHDYESLHSELKQRVSKLVKNKKATKLVRTDQGIAVRYHETDVVLFRKNGDIVLNTGGWKTKTTSVRINEWLPDYWSLYSERGLWTLADRREGWEKAKLYAFRDGITIRANGEVVGAKVSHEAEIKMRKKIRAFATEFIAKLKAGEIPAPGPGDCWSCLGLLEPHAGRHQGNGLNGGPAQDVSPDHGDHIRSHLMEGYYVPTMLRQAVEAYLPRYFRNSVYAFWVSDDHPQAEDAKKFRERIDARTFKEMEKALRRFLCRKLGLGDSR